MKTVTSTILAGISTALLFAFTPSAKAWVGYELIFQQMNAAGTGSAGYIYPAPPPGLVNGIYVFDTTTKQPIGTALNGFVYDGTNHTIAPDLSAALSATPTSTLYPVGSPRPFGASPTTFTPSSTRPSLCSYTFQVAATLTLGATIFFEVSDDAGSTWKLLGQWGIGLGVLSTQSQQITGWVPANNLTRLRTTGSATVTYLTGQETVF